MKKIFLLFTFALIATAHAKIVAFDDMPRIICLGELSAEKIQEFIDTRDPDFIVELKEGTTVPLQFLAKTRVFSALIDPNLTFKVDKTCYLRVANKKCYMSEDLVNWEKAGRFMDGRPIIRLYPSPNKPGFVLESNLVPRPKYVEEETEEEED